MQAPSKVNQVWGAHGVKFMRYCGVSAFNVVLGQSLLLLFQVIGFGAVSANLSAIAIGTLPSYLLARRYVWAKTGRHSLRREVLPFWGLNVMGAVLSTLAVHIAAQTSDSVIAVNAASIAAWLTVWVIKYLLLDKAIFRAKARDAAAAAVSV